MTLREVYESLRDDPDPKKRALIKRAKDDNPMSFQQFQHLVGIGERGGKVGILRLCTVGVREQGGKIKLLLRAY